MPEVTEAIYRDYDQAALDAQYNNRARFPNYREHFQSWQHWSEVTRAGTRAIIDVPFGPTPEEKIDIFPADQKGAPIYVFIHGGYWYSLDKSDYSYIADGMKPHGFATVVNNFILAPHGTMDQIMHQNRAALAWLWQHAAEFGGDRDRIYVAGHSAGGHLAAMLLATDWPSFAPGLPAKVVAGACAIGGIFDLEPIRLSFLDKTLHLTSSQVQAHSPLRQRYPVKAPLLLVVAKDESDEFHRQSEDMKALYQRLGQSVDLVVPDKLDHFDVVNQLRDPKCGLIDLQLRHIRRSFGG